jgi:hypothetical protein
MCKDFDFNEINQIANIYSESNIILIKTNVDWSYFTSFILFSILKIYCKSFNNL